MATTEHTINDAIASILRRTRRAWTDSAVVSSENTGMLKGGTKRPDILLTEENVSPVVIENEVIPAVTVEAEALSRLGSQLKTNGRTILSAIALRSPSRLRTKMEKALKTDLQIATDLEMALYTGTSPTAFSRWPKSGWLEGSIADLSILAQSASVPPEVIEAAADQLVSGVSEAASLIEEMAKTHSGATHKISEDLHQEDSTQTRRMAATILVNAFVFHEHLAGGPGKLNEVLSLAELESGGSLTKARVLEEWKKVLSVNYWPIFDIARRMLEHVPTENSTAFIKHLALTAAALLEKRLMRSHDLTGAVFQRLIADRKFLAAYYTTPASAALLVGLAIHSKRPPGGKSWSNKNDIVGARIADFACGTGTLLSTAYQRIGQLYEVAGGDSEAVHADMMASTLVGCDVLPAASHLTAAMLSGAHPRVTYTQGSILTVAYGRQPDGAVALGSLDLLDTQRKFEVVDITAKSVEAMGEKEHDTWLSLPHASFDLVIMNPPFTRSTGHEGGKIGVPRPMFAAFSSTEEEQKQMSRATARLTAGTSAHGNAGEASIFLVLADKKLKAGGTLALVMPVSLISGEAWEDSRLLLAKGYTDLVFVTIAGAASADMSFSADTDMGECLAIAKKGPPRGAPRATFVVLNRRPPYPMLGAYAARQIREAIAAGNLKRLEGGPVGGDPISFGGDVVGQVLDAPLPKSGSWNLARIADLALAQSAYQLAINGIAWLPGMAKSAARTISMTTIGSIGEIGPYHADVVGNTASGGVRGPFKLKSVKSGGAPTYPILWAHDATRERAMCFEADSEGIPIKTKKPEDQQAVDDKISSVFATASHCHFNRDFRFNSQATSMQFSKRRAIGGRAWLSIKLKTASQEKALTAWSNTTFGLLMYWWHANKSQDGRGSIGKEALSTLPVLDVTALSQKSLKAAADLFDSMCDKKLLPLNEIDCDPIRAELDVRFMRDVLALPQSMYGSGESIDLVRRKLAREPSIHGQKGGGGTDNRD